MIKDNIVFCICDFETTGLDPEKDLPIEIGCIFTDHKFRELGRYESFINWPPELLLEGEAENQTIKRTYLLASFVHQINVSDILEAPHANEVIVRIAELVHQYRPKPYGKVILLSDNIRFEWQFMQKLFGDSLKVESLFHYAGWDINLLCELVDLDRPKENKAHRALADCEGLLDTLHGVRDGLLIK